MRYVLFHSSCYDGFGSAFSAWKKFGDKDTKYIPVSHGAPPPDMPDAFEIWILDFTYPKDVIEKLASKALVTVLDHHLTAQKNLEALVGRENPKVVFDMTRSGAKITWEYLHDSLTPLLIEHISDRDLWKFKLDGSATIHKALVSYPMEFEVWDKFLEPGAIDRLKEEWETCERLYTQLVNNICHGAWIGEIDGHKVPMVNTSIAWSEVGQKLLETYPDADFAASFTVYDTQVMWSLRSKEPFDVSAVALKFGGGGHAQAAGFRTPRF